MRMHHLVHRVDTTGVLPDKETINDILLVIVDQIPDVLHNITRHGVRCDGSVTDADETPKPLHEEGDDGGVEARMPEDPVGGCVEGYKHTVAGAGVVRVLWGRWGSDT